MIRSQVARVACALVDEGLNLGTAGNVSAREGDSILITPSGVDARDLGADEVVEIDPTGNPGEGALRPSSEWPFHAAIYRARPDVGAIVHTHSPWASAVACGRREMPAFHYMVAVAGGRSIRCAPYAPPGSEALAAGVVEALGSRQACLLANHGAVAVASDLAAAHAMAREVELLAQQFALAHLVGGPVLLEHDEMDTLQGIFRRYGQPQP